MRSRILKVNQHVPCGSLKNLGSFVVGKGIEVVDITTKKTVVSAETVDGVCSAFVINLGWKEPRFLVVALPSAGKRSLKDFIGRFDA